MKSDSLWVAAALVGTVAADKPTTTCSAELIAKVCDYPSAGPEFSVASGGKEDCWAYCNAHQPCSFAIFAAGNPHTGTGSCLLYPGESYDASKATTKCGNPTYSVYKAPTCTGGTPTDGPGACAATATPSAVAKVCGYPAPGDCFHSCTASSSATSCLSQCVGQDSCAYAVFNPHNPDNTPYSDGSCWMYSEGQFDPKAAKSCSGAPEQFVYTNPCPKPKPPAGGPKSTSGPTGTSSPAASSVSPNGSSVPSGASSPSGGSGGNAGSSGTETASAGAGATSAAAGHGSAAVGIRVNQPVLISIASLVMFGLCL